MKWAIVSDMHGRDLYSLEKALEREGAKRILCLGDFDQTSVMHQLMALEKLYKVEIVAGNHDHAILNCLPISSATLRKQGKGIKQLHDELKVDAAAFEFLNGLVNGDRSIVLEIGGRKTIMIHGALAGSLYSFPYCPEEIQELWMRLENSYDHNRNFCAMETAGLEIMLRGHDHKPGISYRDKEGIKFVEVCKDSTPFVLKKNAIYTINPGAYFDGWFATLETNPESMVLKHHKLFE